MEVRFVTRNVELPGDIKDYMEKKLFKIEKFFDRILDTQVALNYKRGMNVVEITSNVNAERITPLTFAKPLTRRLRISNARLKNIRATSPTRSA